VIVKTATKAVHLVDYCRGDGVPKYSKLRFIDELLVTYTKDIDNVRSFSYLSCGVW
jgi:hypothetical protein